MTRYLAIMLVVLLLAMSLSGCWGGQGAKGQNISFAQLFSNPGKYNGKDITIEGFYFQGWEISVFCEELTHSVNSGWLSPTKPFMWVDGGMPPEVYQNLVQRTPVRGYPERAGRVKITGRFDYGEKYGHLGAYDSRITPATVELLPWSPPTNQQ